MGRCRHTILGVLGVASLLASGCVRLDVGDSAELAPTARQLSDSDTVVLCPLAADVAAQGNGVMVAFAGYPAGDDRLQIMVARVTMEAELVEAPRPIALLDTELSGLELDASANGLRVRSVDVDGNELDDVRLDHSGRVNPYLALAKSHRSIEINAERCEQIVEHNGRRLRLFRSQVDGALPLFVETLQ